MKFFVIFMASTIIGVPLLAEVMLRFNIKPEVIKPPRDLNYSERALQWYVQQRIRNIWDRKKPAEDSPFIPPMFSFINRDFDDPDRLNFIREKTAMPASQKFMMPNFLVHPDIQKEIKYKVTTNSFGFRGPERSLEKPKGVYRILVFGSYPAFGHGASDEDTYSHLLENFLNTSSKSGLKFEVWNGGRQAATAIMGYSRLVLEAEKYDPDLIIWDFGWVEKFMRTEKNPFLEMDKNEVSTSMPVGKFRISIIRGCRSFPIKLHLCQQLIEKISQMTHEQIVDDWFKINRSMIQYTQSRKWPVIVVRHGGVAFGTELFEPFIKNQEGVHFVDTTKAMRETPISDQEWNEFWSKPNWLLEIGKKPEDTQRLGAWIRRGDAIQYNKFGYKIIAQILSQRISEITECCEDLKLEKRKIE